jgi:hypothetical protein
MIVAVPEDLLASPLRNGRDPGDSGRSALVIGGTEKIRTGGRTVFLKVVAVTQAVVTRGGQVRAEGRPYDHATLGPVEDWLDAQAGPGVIDGIAERAVLDSRFVKGRYRRLLSAAFMIRVIVLWTVVEFTNRFKINNFVTCCSTSRTCSRRPGQEISDEEVGVSVVTSERRERPGPGR